MSKQTRHNRKKRAWLRDLKRARGCERCGRKRIPANQLDFHHLDPATKDFNISQHAHCRSFGDLRAEIAKCEVLCTTCHAETDTYGIGVAA